MNYVHQKTINISDSSVFPHSGTKSTMDKQTTPQIALFLRPVGKLGTMDYYVYALDVDI